MFAHTPDGTGCTITLTPEPGGATLVVDDDGPGFPAGDLRRRGASTAGSTGLGLDIATRAAHRTGGHLDLGTSPTGGGRVTVHFEHRS